MDYNILSREYARHRQALPEVVKNLVETGKLNSAMK
jgi:hypothetical protein